jgi:putative hydrolase of the HAD superfamily
MFQLVYDQLKHKNLNKKDVLHIGDNPLADYDGAIKFGYNALLIKK